MRMPAQHVGIITLFCLLLCDIFFDIAITLSKAALMLCSMIEELQSLSEVSLID